MYLFRTEALGTFGIVEALQKALLVVENCSTCREQLLEIVLLGECMGETKEQPLKEILNHIYSGSALDCRNMKSGKGLKVFDFIDLGLYFFMMRLIGKDVLAQGLSCNTTTLEFKMLHQE